ncbi:MAG: HU family DNA-binding protein [Lentisphaerae bacterium]|nr:HU family DNA-binding protein [Lentisphaerota bacterium]
MAKTYLKSQLISELAAKTSFTQKQITTVLEELANIAYREAANGFTIPGICKLKVIKKKACRRRNPATGQLLEIGEREILKAVPVKKAKDTVTPKPMNLVHVVADDIAARPATIPQPKEEDSAISSAEAGQVVFTCPNCGNVLAASPESVGTLGECPYCHAQNIVPGLRLDSEQDSVDTSQQASNENQTDTEQSQQDSEKFIDFFCPDCEQEIEATSDMIGLQVSCPTCGTPLIVPAESQAPTRDASEITSDSDGATSDSDKAQSQADRRAMTIRIDLSDLE